MSTRDWPKLFRENPELRDWAQEFLAAREAYTEALHAFKDAWEADYTQPSVPALEARKNATHEVVLALQTEPADAAIANATNIEELP